MVYVVWRAETLPPHSSCRAFRRIGLGAERIVLRDLPRLSREQQGGNCRCSAEDAMVKALESG